MFTSVSCCFLGLSLPLAATLRTPDRYNPPYMCPSNETGSCLGERGHFKQTGSFGTFLPDLIFSSFLPIASLHHTVEDFVERCPIPTAVEKQHLVSIQSQVPSEDGCRFLCRSAYIFIATLRLITIVSVAIFSLWCNSRTRFSTFANCLCFSAEYMNLSSSLTVIQTFKKFFAFMLSPLQCLHKVWYTTPSWPV